MNTVANAIQFGEDTYVPAFELFLDKQRLGQELLHDVLSVTYRDDIDKFDSFDFTINNWDDERLDFKYCDSDDFLPGKRVELWLGYRSGIGLRKLISGKIKTLTPAFPASGASTLTVGGLNILDDFRKQRRSRRYHRKTDSEIATEIAGRLNFKLHIDKRASQEEPRLEELLQDNEYDIVFLIRRAREIGYELIVEESDKGQPELHFRPSDHVRPGNYTLGYLGSKKNRVLIDFAPTFSTTNQCANVSVHGWSATRKEAIKVTVPRDGVNIKDPPLDRASIADEVRDREEVVTNRPVQDRNEARQVGRQVMTRIKQRMVEAKATTIGLPDLRAGSVVHIEGVGKRFSGRYFVTASEHQLGANGYTTSFNCRREEV